jgi:hypothetical protein
MDDEATWAGLRRAQAALTPIDIENLTEMLPEVMRETPVGELLGPIEGVEDTYARLAMLAGAQGCAEPAAALNPLVDEAAERYAQRLAVGALGADEVTYGVSLLNLMTGLRGTGHRPPGVDDARAAAWLPRIGTALGEVGADYQRRGACAAAGYGHWDLANRVLAGPLAGIADLDPLREVVAAVAAGGDTDVEGPWLHYLFVFPVNRVAGLAAFGELVAVGRAVYVLAGGVPEPELVERIRADLR